MKNEELKKASGYIKTHQLQKRWQKVVTCLAAVVVFCTTYALILPAITLEKGQTLDCSYEVHQHEDSCYDAEGNVICGYADYVVHTHDADYCYDENSNLVCGLEEIEEHVHGASCYEEQKVLTCKQEESEGHVHEETCYTSVRGELICENTEEDHEHTDDCYEWTETLSCGLDAGEGAHQHSDDCYTTEKVLVCNKQEILLYTHTDDCFDGEGNWICGKLQVEEHTHGAECLSAATEAGEGEGTESTDGTDVSALTEDDLSNQSQMENDGISLMSLLPETELAKGTFGENDCLTWTVTEDDSGIRTLTVTGAGAMPDLANDTAQPWRDYYTTITKIVVGDEVTCIGDNAFKRCFATEVVIGSEVTDIGTQAFGYMTKIEEITVPGNVKTLGTAFQYASSLKKVYLEEGTESIDLAGFVGTGIGSSGNTIDIPSTVTTVITSGDSTAYTAGYTVAEENQYYYTDEYGALYRWNDETKTMATLVGYPTHGSASNYTVPSNVTAIAGRAFRANKTLKELTIPDTVTGQITQQTFRDSDFVKITLGSNHIIASGTGSLFVSCSLLEEVVLPDTITNFGAAMFSGCTSLRSITIGEKVTQLASDCLKNCVSLENVYYNAANCTSILTGFGSGAPYYALTIGTEVDTLSASFTGLAAHAESITFEGPNYITVAEGALAGGPSALSTLSGTIYIDENGMIYSYEKEKGSASLVYCPDGLYEVTVPATIQAEDGTELKVNRVDKYAFTENSGLTTVAFKDASGIEEIGERAFYGCAKLTAIHDEKTNTTASTVTESKNLFEAAAVGRQAFEATGLTQDSENAMDQMTEDNMDGQKLLSISPASGNDNMKISVSSGGGTMVWKPQTDEEGNESETGGYHLLTGDSMTVAISVGNQDGTNTAKYRVYFELTEESGTLDLIPGTTIMINNGNGAYAVECHATEDSHIVYLEFDSEVGVTFSIPVTANYPNGTSSGGGLRIWGFAVAGGSMEEGEVIVPEENQTIDAYWSTQRDPFTLTKTNNNVAAVNLTGDGAGGAKLASDLVWKITLLRDAANSSSLGKDYLTSVNLSDTLELPTGISWSQSVLEAVKNGNIRRSGNVLYAGDTAIAQLVVGSGTTLTGVSADLKEDHTITLSGTVRNTSSNSEMPDVTLVATVYAGALSVDLNVFNMDEAEHTVTNTASAVLNYMFSDPVTKTHTAEKTLKTSDANVKLAKTATLASYFGEDITYTLTVSNSGTSDYPAVAQPGSDSNKLESIRLEDELHAYTYIRADNIDRMLREADYQDLTVTIKGATLASQVAVTGVDGTTSWKTSANSNLDGVITNATVTVTLAEDKKNVVVTVTSGEKTETYRSATAAEALAAAGYAVNNGDTYKVTWQLPDGADGFRLVGGESREFHIYATAKDTFQLLNRDEPNEYPGSSALTLTNEAAVYEHYTGSKDKTAAKASLLKPNSVSREVWLDKSVRSGGEMLKDGFSVEDGEQLEYEIDFTHRGSGVYTDMPLVDDMYGSQHLLVPTEANKNNDSLIKLKKYTGDDGVEYYILSEGTYKNVVVGTDDTGTVYKADTITVTAAQEETSVGSYSYTGLHTQIQWYYPEVSDSGSYQVQVTYQALVDTSLTSSNSYAIGNMVWMNDKTGSRLYASLWGGGTILDFDKEIVTSQGETPAEDVIAENKYSMIREGDTVTYRLELTNKGNSSYKFSGSDLADALPNNGGAFTWEKNNISIEVEAPEGVTVFGIANGWDLSNEWNNTASTEQQQYILWPETAFIQYTGAQSVYIYVTLTFPSDTDGGDAAWSQYCDAIGGGFVENILYVYRYSVNVTHNLYEEGEALLQKGVYGTYYYTNSESSSIKFTETGSRIYYNNRDYQDRAIVYYTVLYNGGNKRLYLDDLYDILPRGFTYKSLMADGSKIGTNTAVTITSTITTVTSGSSMFTSTLDTGAGAVSYRSAVITEKDGSDGMLQFHISGSSGSDSVKYDEELGRYYLDKNEAIVFGYLCDIGESSATENQAENTIGMAYYDTLGSGVTAADEVSFSGKTTSTYTETNDGSCQVESWAKAQASGMPVGEEQQWLISDVTVSRGGIVPGVTKYTESYTRNGETSIYSSGVMPKDTVNWRVKLQNSGELSITDYTFRDVMPSPYVFTGDVKLTVYDGNGTALRNMTLFSIETRSENDKTLTLAYSTNKSEKLVIGGESLTLTVSSGNVAIPFGVSFAQDSDGNEILTLNLTSRYLSIPEGGYVEITYSSVNPSTSYNNQSYINEALLIPNVQEYDRAAQGTLITDENGTIKGVRNYSPVTVSFSYSTRSDKTVEEQGLTEGTVNQAVASDTEKNQILLSSTNSVFQYTLKVYNDTDQDMRDLVIIDNLPENGDGSAFDPTVDRGSQFKVSLTGEPNVEVKIYYTDKDGNPAEYKMIEGEYRLQYSTKTEFTENDWKWSSKDADDWKSEAKDARALRVMIHTTETTGVIPKGTEIQVSFNARIDGTAQPGTIAWNSFGYQYSVDQTNFLSALSLRVGVKALEVPTLQKKLETDSGEALAAAGDIAFRFYVYEGDKLSGSYDSETALKAALDGNNRKYQDFSVTVAAGESASEKLPLTADNWSFEEGKTYTIVEVSDAGLYSQSTWNSAKRDSYTFKYDSDTALTLTCVNVGHAYELPETGGSGTTLYTIGGLLLLTGAGILLLYNHKKHRKEDFASS